jgi:O-acetyl-ADP-ribose deacetylase (regulator of RNase III)
VVALPGVGSGTLGVVVVDPVTEIDPSTLLYAVVETVAPPDIVKVGAYAPDWFVTFPKLLLIVGSDTEALPTANAMVFVKDPAVAVWVTVVALPIPGSGTLGVVVVDPVTEIDPSTLLYAVVETVAPPDMVRVGVYAPVWSATFPKLLLIVGSDTEALPTAKAMAFVKEPAVAVWVTVVALPAVGSGMLGVVVVDPVTEIDPSTLLYAVVKTVAPLDIVNVGS